MRKFFLENDKAYITSILLLLFWVANQSSYGLFFIGIGGGAFLVMAIVFVIFFCHPYVLAVVGLASNRKKVVYAGFIWPFLSSLVYVIFLPLLILQPLILTLIAFILVSSLRRVFPENGVIPTLLAGLSMLSSIPYFFIKVGPEQSIDMTNIFESLIMWPPTLISAVAGFVIGCLLLVEFKRIDEWQAHAGTHPADQNPGA
jgi:hypothetical protein